LDLSEAFKPVVVFKTIFDCVNKKKLQVAKHFDKSVNYALLNETGKKIFIENFENRINETFMHPTLKRKTTYKSALRYDAYKLIKYLLEDKPFKPFLLKDKC
jgi:CRISPR-associated protein Cas1